MALLLKKKVVEQKVEKPSLVGVQNLKKKVSLVKVPKTPSVPEKPMKKESLPPNEYTPLLPQVTIPISDSLGIVLRATRGGEMGLPRLDIREYVKSERYTGFTKKGINVPLEFIGEILHQLHGMTNSHPVQTALKEMEEIQEDE